VVEISTPWFDPGQIQQELRNKVPILPVAKFQKAKSTFAF
jgi:hypothetical protein